MYNVSMKRERFFITGFTLIELLVVVSIIGLLFSIVFANITAARLKARDTRRFVELGQVRKELFLYFNANGFYPALPGACGSATWAESNVPACWRDLGEVFASNMPHFPVDPLNMTIDGIPYIYAYQRVNGGATQVWIWFGVLAGPVFVWH